MSPERFEKDLKRLCGSSLEVFHDSVHAVRTGLHPDTLQVWDVGPRGTRYLVKSIVDEGNRPREPYDYDVRDIQRMSADRRHGGCKSWGNLMLHQWDERKRHLEAKAAEDRSERFKEYGANRLYHAAGHGRVYAAAHIK